MHIFPAAALLDSLQQQTESLLQKVVTQWQMMPPAKFSKQPAPGSWSAAQCLSHLNGYGDYYLPLLEGAIRKARAQKKYAETFRPGWLGEYFTKLMQPGANGTVAKRLKAFRNHIPPEGEDSDAVIAKFIDQQEQLLQLLESARGLDLSGREVPVSIAPFIRLKTGDVFRFLIAHNLRHAAQAERALGVTTTALQSM